VKANIARHRKNIRKNMTDPEVTLNEKLMKELKVYPRKKSQREAT
jgi:hypothetical protein